MWTVKNSDPHAAVGFDRLHWNCDGVFAHHLWPELQDIVVDGLGRDATKQINNKCV